MQICLFRESRELVLVNICRDVEVSLFLLFFNPMRRLKVFSYIVFFSILFSFAPNIVCAGVLQGTVRDASGEVLPFATIYVEGTTKGATTNEQGVYQLKLNDGEYSIIVKYMGYKTHKEQVEVRGVTNKDFVLEHEDILFDDVIITSDGRDPAYGIIRKAIDRRKQNEIPYKTYRFNSYVKTVFRAETTVDSTVNTAMLQALGGEDIDTTQLGQEEMIAFLEETVSEVTIKKPGRRKEKVISSQVSGMKGEFSFLGTMIAQILDFNPYRNLIPLRSISNRGIVSPISGSAFSFYDYKLLGTVMDKGHKAYKIQVIPKRNTDPVCTGQIYILDDSYAVKDLDVFIARENQINTIDTLHAKLNYVPLNDSVWVPFSLNYRIIMNMNIFGIRIGIDGLTEMITSQYVINPEIPKGFFDNELLSITDDATDKDSAYWEDIRPIPLREEESRDYFEKDSIYKVQHSPEYLDSLTRKSRKFSFNRFLLMGYHTRNYRKEREFNLDSPLDHVGFNPMEGWFAGLGGSRKWEHDELRFTRLSGAVRYGFANKKVSYRAGLFTRINPKRKEHIGIYGGDYVSQFSGFEQLGFGLNSYYCLLGHISHIRLYQEKYLRLKYQRELMNGVRVTVRTGVAGEERNGKPDGVFLF